MCHVTHVKWQIGWHRSRTAPLSSGLDLNKAGNDGVWLAGARLSLEIAGANDERGCEAGRSRRVELSHHIAQEQNLVGRQSEINGNPPIALGLFLRAGRRVVMAVKLR